MNNEHHSFENCYAREQRDKISAEPKVDSQLDCSVSDDLQSLIDEAAKLPEPDLDAMAKHNAALAEDPRFKRAVSEMKKQNEQNQRRA